MSEIKKVNEFIIDGTTYQIAPNWSFIKGKPDFSKKQDKLPQGSSNEIIVANNEGANVRSGYFFGAEEKYMTEEDKSGKYIPTAQLVTKKINNAVLPYEIILKNTNGIIEQIARGGYTANAPENSGAAFVLAKTYGFDGIETGVQKTKDGKYILSFESALTENIVQNIDKNNTPVPADINTLTLEQLRKYDIGKVNGADSTKYINTKVLTLNDGLKICKNLGLKIYINIEDALQIEDILNIVKINNMLLFTVFVSTQPEVLKVVKDIYAEASLLYKSKGFVAGDKVNPVITTFLADLKTDINEVAITIPAADCQTNSYFIDEFIDFCVNNDIKVCSWFSNAAKEKETAILNTHPYASIFIAGKLMPKNILHTHTYKLYIKK